MLADIYYIGIIVFRVLIFIASYIYCIAAYGFLFGLGLGWIPSAILAYLLAWVWPLAVALIIAAIVGLIASA